MNKFEKIKDILISIDDCTCYSDVAKKLDIYKNPRDIALAKRYVESKGLSTDHFDHAAKNRRGKIIEKECPICSAVFETKENHPKEKMTCSTTCANTYFRSGENNGNYKYGSSSYRKLKKIFLNVKDVDIMNILKFYKFII